MRALCAIDLTEDEGEVTHELQDARRWLEPFGATVDLLFVEAPLPAHLTAASPDPELAGRLLAAVMQRDKTLQQRLDDLLAAWPADRRGVGYLSHEHGAADEIGQRAAHYDLVVVSTHGRRGLTRAWIGSVAEKVVRASPVPVLVLRRSGAGEQRNPAILAAVDGWDPGAESVVDEAGRWAGRLHAKVDLLHALTVPLPAEPTLSTGFGIDRQLESLGLDAARRVVHMAERLPVEVRGTPRAVWGEASAVVCTASPDYGLVVVGTHGRSGLGRLWLGSVAERTVRRSSGPVLVVPTRG